MKFNTFVICFLFWGSYVWAQSEPSTYFNVFIPPNNEAVQRNVALIITAVSDSTYFTIADDGMDGDNDDQVTGMLMAGQSYILYIKDNGINDDARYASGGVLARNGDYFTIRSNKIVYASMSTDSDWQHDFVPSVSKKSIGQKFFVYAPKVSSSPRDLNVFAYDSATTISIYKISTVPTTQTGYTNIDLARKQLVVQKTIHPGQDIIHYFTEGRDVMQTGGTYLIEANKDVSVQYGALWGNARDGGGYVPSSNGSGSGNLFYFAVPYQSNGEQEIRIVSWDDSNTVQLSRYQNGNWISMNTWALNKLKPADWVGKQNGNATYPTVFRVSCSAGKRVSVMEANWMETGSTTTSDMSTMLSSESGTSSGKKFLAYMLPPSSEGNVVNPFTGQPFAGSISHFYLFAGSKKTVVTIKDAKTNGLVLNKTYSIDSGRYADAFFTMAEWQRIYNGTGTPSGPERPYVVIEATEHIAVLSTNFNDNWMSYFGSSLPQSFTQSGSLSSDVANPGEIVTLNSNIEVSGTKPLENATIEVKIASGLIPIESNLKSNNQVIQQGTIRSDTTQSVVTFKPLPAVSSSDRYSVETKVVVAPTYNNGAPIPNQAVLSLETVVSGTIDSTFQQSYSSQGVQNNSANTSNLMYSICHQTTVSASSNNSWNASWADYNNDGHEDLLVATKDASAFNELYRNNGNGTFTKIANHPLANEKSNTVAVVWADINNDGERDALVVNASHQRSKLFLNTGKGNFEEIKNSGISPHPQYFHGAAFADFDNDGFVDLIMTNFFQTQFHHLYRNNGDNTFSAVTNTPVTLETERAMAPILADYNNDGLTDIFIPNGNNRPNTLLKNVGNFQFEKVQDPVLNADAKNSVGAAWGDFNNDGYQDLVVLNASAQKSDLYQNNGKGSFVKMDTSIVCSIPGDNHGAVWLDANNDGWLDLYVTNDRGISNLFMNSGKGSFTRKIGEVVSAGLGKACGVTANDYNKDGFQDLVVTTHTDGSTKFFCNNRNANNWVGFLLHGEYSNKQAIGAKVAVKSNGFWQYRQYLPVSGFGSQSTHYIHFGIGNARTLDSVVITWPSGNKQFIPKCGINTYHIVLEEAAKKVTGLVFHDLNGNGVKDSGEQLLPNIRLNINNGSMHLASTDQGSFMFRTQSDSVKISINQAYWMLKPQYARYAFAPKTDTLVVLLPLQAVQVGYDLNVEVSTTAWRRGFTSYTTIQVCNKGTTNAYNAKVQLVLPPEVSLVESDRVHSAPASGTYIWDLDTLVAGACTTVLVTDSVGLSAFVGQKLMVQVSTFATGKDINQLDNSIDEEVEVVGAIDPNDILVSPRGDGKEGYIHKEQPLTYTVRFENIGTYKATFVTLENQIPSGTDRNSFEVIGASHPYKYTLDESGKLKVFFQHINLPTAEEDPVGAHGYFKYRIKPELGVYSGYVIRNKCDIVFDFENPITTNTVINTIKHNRNGEVKKLKIFPNPAQDAISLNIDEMYYTFSDPPFIVQWHIEDYTGRNMTVGSGNVTPEMEIDISEIQPGIYVVKALDDSGQIYVGKFVKHY